MASRVDVVTVQLYETKGIGLATCGWKACTKYCVVPCLHYEGPTNKEVKLYKMEDKSNG